MVLMAISIASHCLQCKWFGVFNCIYLKRLLHFLHKQLFWCTIIIWCIRVLPFASVNTNVWRVKNMTCHLMKAHHLNDVFSLFRWCICIYWYKWWRTKGNLFLHIVIDISSVLINIIISDLPIPFMHKCGYFLGKASSMTILINICPFATLTWEVGTVWLVGQLLTNLGTSLVYWRTADH